jgi:hypothetical protein
MPHDKTVGIVVVVIIIVLLIWWYNTSPSNNESFVQQKTLEQVMQDQGVLPGNVLVPKMAQPVHYDPNTMSMMTSPDFIPSSIEPAWSVDVDSDSQIYDKPEFNSVLNAIDTATNLGDKTLAYNHCSKSCCSKQYPLPFKLAANKEIVNNADDFVPSSYTCNNQWEDSGCLCMNKKQSALLQTHAGNLRSD